MINSYIRAGSIDEAIKALEINKPSSRIFAGGTNLIPKIKSADFKKEVSFTFVDIKHIDELKGVYLKDGWISIGPATTLNELIDDRIIKEQVSVLADAAETIGSLELRNRGTVGGNICSKNISADLVAPLVALEGVVEVCSSEGLREILLKDYLESAWLKSGREELITSIKVPLSEFNWGYGRWTKESMGRAYAIALAGLKTKDSSEDCHYCIVLGGKGIVPRQFEGNIKLGEISEEKARITFASGIVGQVAAKEDYWFSAAAAVLSDALVHAGR